MNDPPPPTHPPPHPYTQTHTYTQVSLGVEGCPEVRHQGVLPPNPYAPIARLYTSEGTAARKIIGM